MMVPFIKTGKSRENPYWFFITGHFHSPMRFAMSVMVNSSIDAIGVIFDYCGYFAPVFLKYWKD